MISSFFWVSGVVLSIAFTAFAFVTVALGPSLTAVGLVSGHTLLVTAGNDLATSEGLAVRDRHRVILLSAGLLAGGWRWTTRIMNSLWVLTMLGLGTVLLVLLFKSKAGFIHSFNQFSSPITGEPDSYHSLIKAAGKEGIDTTPAFSLNNTWPTFAAIAGLSIYSWLSIYISGEVRRAKDTTQMKIMSLATVRPHRDRGDSLGRLLLEVRARLLRRVNALSGTESYPFAAPPYYTFLTSIAGGSTLLAWWLFITFAVAYPLLILPNITIAVRTFFAWALDGILPSQFARVSPETHAPNYAIGLTVVISVLVLYWAISSGEGFLKVLYRGGACCSW